MRGNSQRRADGLRQLGATEQKALVEPNVVDDEIGNTRKPAETAHPTPVSLTGLIGFGGNPPPLRGERYLQRLGHRGDVDAWQRRNWREGSKPTRQSQART